jgi:hypothetical protein
VTACTISKPLGKLFGGKVKSSQRKRNNEIMCGLATIPSIQNFAFQVLMMAQMEVGNNLERFVLESLKENTGDRQS